MQLWICSYLTGHSQAIVVDDGALLDWLFTTADVPQGSVLGPLLFSFFIVDIRNKLKYAKGVC